MSASLMLYRLKDGKMKSVWDTDIPYINLSGSGKFYDVISCFYNTSIWSDDPTDWSDPYIRPEIHDYDMPGLEEKIKSIGVNYDAFMRLIQAFRNDSCLYLSLSV